MPMPLTGHGVDKGPDKDEDGPQQGLVNDTFVGVPFNNNQQLPDHERDGHLHKDSDELTNTGGDKVGSCHMPECS